MKKLILLTLATLFITQTYAQSQVEKDLQNKYWVYKDRFNKHFVRIGEEPGESLTADKIRLGDGSYDLFGRLNFGDVMAFHGDYLGVLTSEYWLLKNEGKSTTGVLNEIYFAINAVERVDKSAEPFYIENSTDTLPNGHFIRDDVPAGFYEVWEGYGDSMHTQGSNAGRGRRVYTDTTIAVQLSTGPDTFRAFFGKEWNGSIIKNPTKDEFYAKDGIYSPLFAIPVGQEDPGNDNYVIDENYGRDPHNHGYGSLVNEMSQDQLIGIFFGFKCVKHFVGSDISVDPDGPGPLPSKNLHQWIADITDGMMNHISKTSFNIPACEAETVAHGNCLNGGNPVLFDSANYIITNPMLGNKSVDRGHLAIFFSPALRSLANDITGNVYPLPFAKINKDVINFLQNRDIVFGLPQGDHLLEQMADGIIFNLAKTAMKIKSDLDFTDIGYAYSQIPIQKKSRDFFSDNPGSNMLINLPAAAGSWDHHLFYALMKDYDCKWAEILWAVLNDSKPLQTPSNYQNWLSAARCDGIQNEINGKDTAHPNFPFTQFTMLNTRKRWKGELDSNGNNKELYGGLDYMLIYNFYRIASQTHFTNTPFSLDNEHWWNTENADVTYQDKKCPCMSSRPFESFGNATVSIEPQDSLETVYRFPEYKDWDINIPEWLKHNFTVKNAGLLKVKGDLNICNAQLTVDQGAILKFSPLTTTRIRTIRVQDGGTLSIGGDLVIGNNTQVIIEKGGKLMLHDGNSIQLNGANAVLHINGDIVLEKDANFAPTKTVKEMGKVIFENNWGEQGVTAKGNNKIIIDGGVTNARVYAQHGNVHLEARGVYGMHAGWGPNLHSFEVKHARVLIGENSQITSEAIRTEFEDVYVSPPQNETARGLKLINSKGVFNNVEIKNMQYGIKYVPLNNKGLLELDNVKTSNCEKGILSEGGGFIAKNSHMVNDAILGSYGIEALGVAGPSMFYKGSLSVKEQLNIPSWPNANAEKINLKHFGRGAMLIKGARVVDAHNGVVSWDGTLGLQCNTIENSWFRGANMAVVSINGSVVMNNGYNALKSYPLNLYGKNSIWYLDDGKNLITQGKGGSTFINISIHPNQQVESSQNGSTNPSTYYVTNSFNTNCIPATNNAWYARYPSYFDSADFRPVPSPNSNILINDMAFFGSTYDLGYNMPLNTSRQTFDVYRHSICENLKLGLSINPNQIDHKSYGVSGVNSNAPVLNPMSIYPNKPATINANDNYKQALVALFVKVTDSVYVNYDEVINEVLFLRDIPLADTQANYQSYTYGLSHDIYYQSLADTTLTDSALQARNIAFGNTMLAKQEELISKSASNEIFWKDINYELKRDKALILRSLDRRPEAIAVLNNLLLETQIPVKYTATTAWKCFIEQEQMVLDSLLSPDSMNFSACVDMLSLDSNSNSSERMIMNVENNKLKDALKLFPNPTRDGFYLKATFEIDTDNLLIIDAMGRTISAPINIVNDKNIFVNTTGLNAGLYSVIYKESDSKKQQFKLTILK